MDANTTTGFVFKAKKLDKNPRLSVPVITHIRLGEVQGAKSLLNEVINQDGDDSSQTKARQLLSKL